MKEGPSAAKMGPKMIYEIQRISIGKNHNLVTMFHTRVKFSLITHFVQKFTHCGQVKFTACCVYAEWIFNLCMNFVFTLGNRDPITA